jgi:glutamine synthetase
MAMNREALIMVCTCEIAGRVRGKGFPAKDLPERMTKGVGWVPTNTMISCFGPIGDTPFGATGDLILVPDPQTEVKVHFEEEGASEHFYLGDIKETDGRPWACCPRNFLRRALDGLEAAAGLKLLAAFEQEFVYTGVEDLPGSPYSLDAYRRQGLFGEVLTAALRQAGVVPDSFLPEYGARQYEVTCRPALGVRAADDAIVMREIVRACALRLGARAIFSPILDPKGVGNGVHIHFSFQDAEGRPVMYELGAPYSMSKPARAFMAGVLRHLPAITAVAAPSAISYLRLTPNRWAPTYAYMAERDREASLRVCPVLMLPGSDPAQQFNVEFRPADAAASPYLALGALVHAGVEGIRQNLEPPAPRDVARMNDAEREAAGIRHLPRSLGEALDLLEATPEAKAWFGPVYLEAYLRHKRAEMRMLEGLDDAAQCARYALTY